MTRERDEMGSEQIARRMIDALSAAGIPYMLAGSISSSYYGIPRSTQDADFVVDLQDRSVMSLRDHLDETFHIRPQIEFETFMTTRRNVIEVADSYFKIELFRLSDDPHDQERFRRRRQVHLFDRKVFLPSPEDVVVMKLRWMRSKDRDDVRDVIAVQGDALDWDYIHHWSDQHGTRQLLDEIRREIPPAEAPGTQT